MDNIPFEIYKTGGVVIVDILYKFYKLIYEHEKLPSGWNQTKVKLIHKGHHKCKKKLDNYRPIALADTVGKIFVGLVNRRIRNLCEINDVMSEEQNGFRADR